jgi:SM-20-related protein
MAAPDFLMNPSLDATALAKRFKADGKLHIPEFLEPECAEDFFQSLRGRNDWALIVNQDANNFDLDRKAQAALSDEQRQALDQAVYAGARYGFQYRYEAIRVPDTEKDRRKRRWSISCAW